MIGGKFALSFFFPQQLLLSVIAETASLETKVMVTSRANYSRNVFRAALRRKAIFEIISTTMREYFVDYRKCGG